MTDNICHNYYATKTNEGTVSIEAVPKYGYMLKCNRFFTSAPTYEKLVEQYEQYGRIVCKDFAVVLQWLKDPVTMEQFEEV